MLMKHLPWKTLALGLAAVCAAPVVGQVTVSIDAGSRGAKIGDLHYGIFFEEINHAGDGGLYAELVRNRSFEDNASKPDSWSAVGSAKMALVTDRMLNSAQAHALEVTTTKAGDGVSNVGFWGMNIVEGQTYSLKFWMRSEGANALSQAQLLNSAGQAIGQAAIAKADGADYGNGWQLYTASITATGSDAKGKLALTADGAGKSVIDVVSLFPPTYKGRENGCRIDLAEMLEAMHPAFVRFPGGCYVEGTFRNDKTNRFEWKNTIGPIEQRPGHYNVNWEYNVSDGMGFHEMLLLTEDLGAEPLFVVNMGLGHGWMVDYKEIGEYIQEALDAIEYCNGSVDTKYGAMRAAAGHPEPFGLRLIEIGNENYNFTSDGNNDQSDHYAERYIQFYNAIKAVYPDIICIGNVEAWGTDLPSWRNPHPVDAVDEHYYRNPSWFAGKYNMYDSYPRDRHKVYVGEYAVTSNFGTNGNLDAALGEAVYMLGMERNSDVVVMNSYAPIFVNENDQRWKPDMIRFNSSESYGTPSYYVQQLMPNYVGKQNVNFSEVGNGSETHNSIGLSTWSTAATFDNVKVTAPDGTVIFSDDFSSNSGAWSSAGGTWSVANGVLTQSDQGMQGSIYACNAEVGQSYTLELEATKTGGAEGFLIAFKYADGSNYAWWNLGGWNNTQHAIENCVNGGKSTVCTTSGNLVNGHTYNIKVVVDGARVKCYLDGSLMFDTTLPVARKAFFSASIDDEAGYLYIKAVNTTGDAVPTTFNISNCTASSAEGVVLASANNLDENSTANQTKVAPAPIAVSLAGNKIAYTIPAYSFTIIKVKVSDIKINPAGGEASADELAAVKDEIANVMAKANFLHTAIALPCGSSEASIEWTLAETAAGYLDFGRSGWTQTVSVRHLADKEPVKAGRLTGAVTFANGKTGTIKYDVTVAPEDDAYGYLYCFMNSGREITNFALGTKEDKGQVFNVLLGGNEVFDTDALAGIEHGTRDAYMAKGQRPDEYFITTTDMKQASSGVWNNYGINLLRSTDMIHWESTTFDFRKGKSIFSDPAATTDAYKTDAEYANIYRVWAPQFIWDPAAFNGQGGYLVYYSCLSSNPGDNLDVVYYSYADKDFKTLTQPRVFYKRAFSVIDADIVLNPYDGLYHLWYKWEGASGGDRGIYEATSPVLVGGVWTDIHHFTGEGSELVEGSSAVRLINEDTYNLYYMRYSGGSAYKFVTIDHVGLHPSGSVKLGGEGAFQHGSVLTLNEKEYVTLERWDEILTLLAYAKEQNSPVFAAAIEQAENALQYKTVAALYDELGKAIDALKAAKQAYIAQLIDPAGETDLTALLVNPKFANGNTGWQGTSIVVNNGVAEHFNKDFDTYQIIEDLPAGVYRFECQGFYRAGSKGVANASHTTGKESLNAKIYANEASAPIMSLFAQDGYTYSPSYTYPDNMAQANTAFNSNGHYTANTVLVALYEPGDLRVGIRKSQHITSDWTCVDNFKLTCVSSDPSGIEAAEAPLTDDPVDIYNAQGQRVATSLRPSEASRLLSPGLYLAGSRKLLIK